MDFETPGQKRLRPARGSHAPGTFWFYNNWDFNVLGTIFQKKTGKKIGEAFYERIAKPIAMQDSQPGEVFYLGGHDSTHPAFLFEMSARDLARFGLLYMRHGRWKNKQIVPEAWVEKSTHANEMVQLNGVDAGGYEYLWWVEYGEKHLAEATLPGMYSARGAGGHYVLVVPSLDLVIVHRVDNDESQNPDSPFGSSCARRGFRSLDAKCRPSKSILIAFLRPRECLSVAAKNPSGVACRGLVMMLSVRDCATAILQCYLQNVGVVLGTSRYR